MWYSGVKSGAYNADGSVQFGAAEMRVVVLYEDRDGKNHIAQAATEVVEEVGRH